MSRRYDMLVICEKRLRKSLITKTVREKHDSFTSQYRLRSYRLLSHAEIEDFIENKIIDKINIIKDLWFNHGVISKGLLNLIAFTKVEFNDIPNNIQDITTSNDFNFRLNRIIANFEKSIEKNNGIKESNILPLLISIGIDYRSLSQTLLNDLSSFGEVRGNTAHHSYKVQTLINPNDEITQVDQIITELNDMDRLIDEI